jgi:hypothetical protein
MPITEKQWKTRFLRAHQRITENNCHSIFQAVKMVASSNMSPLSFWLRDKGRVINEKVQIDTPTDGVVSKYVETAKKLYRQYRKNAKSRSKKRIDSPEIIQKRVASRKENVTQFYQNSILSEISSMKQEMIVVKSLLTNLIMKEESRGVQKAENAETGRR